MLPPGPLIDLKRYAGHPGGDRRNGPVVDLGPDDLLRGKPLLLLLYKLMILIFQGLVIFFERASFHLLLGQPPLQRRHVLLVVQLLKLNAITATRLPLWR